MQLKLHGSDPKETTENWIEFFSKLKEGIITSFTNTVQQYLEDIKRFESQRLLPGWNYCKFFILKVKIEINVFLTIKIISSTEKEIKSFLYYFPSANVGRIGKYI